MENLGHAITEWWTRNKSDPNKWNRTLVGRAIKSIAIESGNWKNAPRGNPRKAGRTSYEKRLQRG